MMKSLVILSTLLGSIVALDGQLQENDMCFGSADECYQGLSCTGPLDEVGKTSNPQLHYCVKPTADICAKADDAKTTFTHTSKDKKDATGKTIKGATVNYKYRVPKKNACIAGTAVQSRFIKVAPALV